MLCKKHVWTYLLAAIVSTAGAVSALAQDIPPMDPKIVPSYEVASIRPSDPNDGSSGFHTDGHRLFIENETTETLIMYAYSVHKTQIVGGPDWMRSEHFDIKGVPDADGEPSQKQQKAMLRKLLTDRFGLAFSKETRTLPVYALTVAKSGIRMTVSKGDPNGLPDQTGNTNNMVQDWRFRNNSMDEFAEFLQEPLERPVLNQTGVSGKFDFYLKWSSADATQTDSAAPPVLFTALREQIGLNIERTKGSVEVLVVTHVERPTAN